jgi:hypothetical protein
MTRRNPYNFKVVKNPPQAVAEMVCWVCVKIAKCYLPLAVISEILALLNNEKVVKRVPSLNTGIVHP